MPNRAASLRPSGAVLMEQSDERAAAPRRYFRVASMGGTTWVPPCLTAVPFPDTLDRVLMVLEAPNFYTIILDVTDVSRWPPTGRAPLPPSATLRQQGRHGMTGDPRRASIEGRARGVLKWAGGKSQLLDVFQHCYPPGLKTGAIWRYIEPFVGSGAVLFDIAARFPEVELVALDRNARLIAAYEVIRDDAAALIDQLAVWQARYWAADEVTRRELYYQVRDVFNSGSGPAVEQAAALVFLNRTGYNGLYRVNRQGRFNVPMGRYRRPLICDVENLRRVQQIFQRVQLRVGDYRDVLEQVNAHTFVYCDPPYRPLSATASFTAYAIDAFGDAQQRELAAFLRTCRDRGASVMLSNSDPHNSDPTDDFFDALYHDWVITRVPARRAINSHKDRRGPVQELVITNYPVVVPGRAPAASRA